MNAELVEQVRRLPAGDKLALVEEIWNSFPDDCTSPATLHLSSYQAEELARRVADHKADPASSISWETAQAHISQRFGIEL